MFGFEKFSQIWSTDMAIDLGTANTLVYVKGQWLVLKGVHGNARRIYKMTPEQSIEYQTKIFSAMKKNSLWNWWNFSSWIKNWRKTCSVDTGI